MPKYKTPSGKVLTLNGTPDEHADAMEEKLRAIRDLERRGDLGESKVMREMTPLLPNVLQEKEEAWDAFVTRLIADIRKAVPA